MSKSYDETFRDNAFEQQKPKCFGNIKNNSICSMCEFAVTCAVCSVKTFPPEQDMVNNPPHYKQGGIECIDAIRAALTPEEFRGYCKGNALKYIWREKHKGGNESMQKANWYINKELEKQ